MIRLIFLFIFISNAIRIDIKNRHPSIQGVYNRGDLGPYNQSCKARESMKSITEHKDRPCKTKHPIQQSFKESEFEIMHSSLHVLKMPIVPLPPHTRHQTMRGQRSTNYNSDDSGDSSIYNPYIFLFYQTLLIYNPYNITRFHSSLTP